MKENSKIFVDTNILIYFLNEIKEYYDEISEILKTNYDNGALFYTSVITKSEVSVKLIEDKNREKIILFNEILRDFEFKIIDIDSSIAIEAAYLRSKYKFLKLPDALQIASYTTWGCNQFFTNDDALKRIKEINFLSFNLNDSVYKEGIDTFNNIRKDAKKNGLQGLSLNEINKIINDTRKSK